MTAEPELLVHPTPIDLTRAAADRIVAAASTAIGAGGRFVMALSGGSTPHALYTLLAGPTYRPRIDWTHVHLFFGDERCVPPEGAASNYHMARESMLAHVPIPAAQVHRMRGEDDPTAAAVAYEGELRTLFDTPAGPPATRPGARFDLVLLGMGDNGHTASIFPRSTAVREGTRWVVADQVDAVPASRVTLTPPIINAAAEVLFLVAGADKASMLKRVLEGPSEPDLLPAQSIVPRDGRLAWLVDAAAAAALARSPRA